VEIEQQGEAIQTDIATERNTPLAYAGLHIEDRIEWTPAHMVMWAAAAFLTLLSVFVVIAGATDEPYYGTIRYADALVQVGAGSALIVLWCVWSGALIARVMRRHTARRPPCALRAVAGCFLSRERGGRLHRRHHQISGHGRRRDSARSRIAVKAAGTIARSARSFAGTGPSQS
jgi:hypothetical protein